MADDALQHDVNGFLSSQDPNTDSLKLEDVDSQQLLADTDALLQSLNRSTTTPKTELKSKREIAKQKAGHRRDAYRQRLKQEWATLRLQDADLTKRLDRLKQIKSHQTIQSSPSDPLALGAWRAIAMRQYERRMESEGLQKKLQAAVNSRAVVIQDLEQTLRKRVREVEKLTTVEVPEIWENKKARLGTKDATLYNTYFENLDVLYKRLEEVFEQVGVNPTPGGIEGRCVYDGLPDPENSVALQFCCPVKSKDGQVFSLKSYHVARRYTERDRIVFVWRGLSEVDGEFPGLNLDETGWTIVHAPTSDADSQADPAMTLVQACIRIVPMHFQDGSDEKTGKLDQFMELLAKTGVEDHQEIERMMERLLLDDALATDGLDIDEDGNLTIEF